MDEYIETVEIKDDFDMEKIRTCGQAFRIRCMSDGGYLFVTGENVLSIRKKEDGIYDISCDLNEWKDVWIPYFDLERDYRAIREKNSGKYPYVDRAMDYGKGLRILRQDPFEMLITFIISQRKNIPAISGAVENLCVRFGRKVERCGRNIHLFPQPKELVSASKEDLNALGMGYRSSYIMDALGKVISGELDIEKISHLRHRRGFHELRRAAPERKQHRKLRGR